jgi:hypothetical protein
MIDREAAYTLVRDYLATNKYMAQIGDSCFILDDATIETEYGWIFFYNSRKYIETGDYKHRLYGNGPIVVEKADASLHPLGSAGGSKKQIELYEKRRRQF